MAMSGGYKRIKKTPFDKIKEKVDVMEIHNEHDNLPTYTDYKLTTVNRGSYGELFQSMPIYSKVFVPLKIKTFRPFFAWSIHGFNPLRTTEMMRLDFKPEQIVQLTRKLNYEENLERLDGRVVKQYIQSDRDVLAEFNKDIELEINSYGFTHLPTNIHAPIWPFYKHPARKRRFQTDALNEEKEVMEGEFDNIHNMDLKHHYRNSTSNDHEAKAWYQFFSKS